MKLILVVVAVLAPLHLGLVVAAAVVVVSFLVASSSVTSELLFRVAVVVVVSMILLLLSKISLENVGARLLTQHALEPINPVSTYKPRPIYSAALRIQMFVQSIMEPARLIDRLLFEALIVVVTLVVFVAVADVA